MYVHVVGRVRSPGVVTVPAGARVEEAIKGAGGVREGADLAQVNLARPVVDGEQVVVPREGGATPVAGGVPAPAGPTAPGAPGGPAGTASPSAPVDLNAADQATLETLPGVGPVLAARIVEWRTTNGGFTAVEELDEVSGIGEKLYAQISPKVTV
ncbi:competence protein ComEA [Janibacter melonis]|uniref:Competence protein ComEA n=1 Tax=Janibacter melonis TaxID=262209 RepID=A0A176QC17_9MICO|nr:competence protein ComEA [Janibacter melonis]